MILNNVIFLKWNLRVCSLYLSLSLSLSLSIYESFHFFLSLLCLVCRFIHPFAWRLSFSIFRDAWNSDAALKSKLYRFCDDLCEFGFYSIHTHTLSLICRVVIRSTKMMTMNNLIITQRMCNIVEFQTNPPSTTSLSHISTHFISRSLTLCNTSSSRIFHFLSLGESRTWLDCR